MNSTHLTLCLCTCKREPMNKIHFDIYNKGKHCEKCGEKFRLIPSPVLGVLVHSEGANSYDWEWISIKELKEILSTEHQR